MFRFWWHTFKTCRAVWEASASAPVQAGSELGKAESKRALRGVEAGVVLVGFGAVVTASGDRPL